MLELYFEYPRVLRRLRSGALGQEMDRIAAHFSELGYKRGSAKVYISRLAKFSEFAARSAGGATIEQDVIDRFVQSCRACGQPRRGSLREQRSSTPVGWRQPGFQCRYAIRRPTPIGRCSALIWTICAKCVASSPRRVTGCLWSHVGSLLGTMAMSPISLYPR